MTAPLLVRRAMAEAAAVQRARPMDYTPTVATLVKAAVQDATRVRITHALIEAARPGLVQGSVTWVRQRARLARAFEAAGFEVEL